MENKRERVKKEQKNFIIGIILAVLFLILLIPISLVAQGGGDNESLRAELDNLTSELSSQGYEWLINYSINETASIEIYRENSDELITTVNDINDEGWYKTYLTGLSEGESYDVFDLNQGGKNE